MSTSRVLSPPILESVCVYLLSQRRLVATLPIRVLLTAYVAEDTPLHDKHYMVTVVTTNQSEGRT